MHVNVVPQTHRVHLVHSSRIHCTVVILFVWEAFIFVLFELWDRHTLLAYLHLCSMAKRPLTVSMWIETCAWGRLWPYFQLRQTARCDHSLLLCIAVVPNVSLRGTVFKPVNPFCCPHLQVFPSFCFTLFLYSQKEKSYMVYYTHRFMYCFWPS